MKNNSSAFKYVMYEDYSEYDTGFNKLANYEAYTETFK